MMSRLAVWSLLVAVVLSLAGYTASASATPSAEVGRALPSEPPAEAGDGKVSFAAAGDGSVSLAAEPGTRIYRIVTLGDSYTYGTGTANPPRDSWPAQMYAALTHRGDMRIYLRNLAQKSSTSGDVIDSQLAYVGGYEPDVVTVQVGVNDIVGRDTESYAEDIALILDELLLILPPERIFAITTPDHTLTEWGSASANRGTHEEVEALNASLLEEAAARGIAVIDIGPLNDRVAIDDSLLVQSDPPKPYPTTKQYAGWAELIGLYVRDALESMDP